MNILDRRAVQWNTSKSSIGSGNFESIVATTISTSFATITVFAVINSSISTDWLTINRNWAGRFESSIAAAAGTVHAAIALFIFIDSSVTADWLTINSDWAH